MDIQMMQEALPQYIQAMGLTLKLATGGIVLALLIGLSMSLISYFKVPVLKNIASAYIALSRNTPLLIQLFFLYYGLPRIGIQLEKEIVGLIGLAFLGGGYMSEAFRAGIESVSSIQIESGQAIGLTKIQLARFIILPQGLASSVPAIGANCLFLLKETSIFSAIAIMDLTNVTRDLIGMYYLTREYLFMLVIAYASVLIPLSLLISLIERRVRYGIFGS
ncbi:MULTISPECIES: amino acid ABC transporter permease [Pseudolactococcus]|uniref:Amino-acid ABC transporter permease component n=1 Tax=Pseudolactococcus piscium MKFS47 TaxID=297352 RepID=A0A0D6DW07_9LACT|nr:MULTISPECIES: amino acid ABC transporter permease [Lactococcus]MCJ1969251.1 amino acid ABC transporter permease [Lactococcus carnosus]MCJ1973350.1 amino acid ABC transporter permease [Lactococcus carnosus]MCJ1975909.1 amino acid ABC transporter permease [Lactococcus carnosus]MCJ1986154.1 amino acid ABC transporter permease [Lactococcus carnosus]CEN27660.1 Amino-acid ABC transporter permease component [Lactococcus piscium MKFS47]